MSRSNSCRTAALALLFALLLALFVAPSASGETLQPDELLVVREQNYRTATAQMGTFTRSRQNSTNEFFPYQANVQYLGEEVKFIEYTVKRGDAVEKGDVLARFSLYASAVDFENDQLNLTRAREAYERDKSDRQESIRNAENELASISEDYGRQMRRLEIDKMQLEYRLHMHRQERSIELQQQRIDEQIERRSRTELLAPISGFIDNIAFKRVDDVVRNGEVLINMHSTDGMLLSIDNSTLDFRYNLPVTIETGTNKERYMITGRVIASDSELPEKSRRGYALIQLDDQSENEKLRNPIAYVEAVRLENVLILPRTAVGIENGKHFVTKLVDGIVKKRFVFQAMYSFQPPDAWIMAGVDEGDVLILD